LRRAIAAAAKRYPNARSTAFRSRRREDHWSRPLDAPKGSRCWDRHSFYPHWPARSLPAIGRSGFSRCIASPTLDERAGVGGLRKPAGDRQWPRLMSSPANHAGLRGVPSSAASSPLRFPMRPMAEEPSPVTPRRGGPASKPKGELQGSSTDRAVVSEFSSGTWETIPTLWVSISTVVFAGMVTLRRGPGNPRRCAELRRGVAVRLRDQVILLCRRRGCPPLSRLHRRAA